jgi:excisionase family DNA binding protein
MHCHHLVSTFDISLDPTAASLGRARRPAEWLAHLFSMDADPSREAAAHRHHDSLEPVLTLSELADLLCVSAQTLYDLRSQGCGPRGFRVGRELRFRVSEIDAWLARMEDADAELHPLLGR